MKRILQTFLLSGLPFLAMAQTTIDGMTFVINDYDNEFCTLSEYNGDGQYIEIPETVIIDGSEYVVNTIGTFAFCGNHTIYDVLLPQSITVINDRAFLNSYIRSINIPGAVRIIDDYAFNGTLYLKDITFEKGTDELYIGKQCFWNTQLDLLEIHRNDISLHNEWNLSWEGIMGINNLIIGEEVTDISWIEPHLYQLNNITCESLTPPTIGGFTDSQYLNSKIYIPYEGKENYENNSQWGFFKNVICFDKSIDEYGITFDPTDVELGVGQVTSVNVKIHPDIDSEFLTYVDNNDIVSIDFLKTDEVKIIGNKPGETDITVILLLNNKKARCHITMIQPAENITLNKTDITLTKGETFEIFAKVAPYNVTDPSVTWRSTNEYVATIEEGLISAIHGGECEIIASTHNGLEAKCQVNVIAYPESINFDITDATLLLEDKLTLTASLEPDDTTERALIWSSSNENVATVDNGVVTCVGLGEAIISATTVNNLSAECKVSVIKFPETIALDITEIETLINNQFTLTAILEPEDATERDLTWTSSDVDIATVENGVVTCVGLGEAIISATTVNNLSAECKVTVVKLVESITISPLTIEIEEGNSVQLVASILPEDASNQKIDWLSDNPSIAEVNGEGLVKTISSGLTIIRAKATDGSGVEGLCEVTGIAGVESVLSENNNMNLYSIDGSIIFKKVTKEQLLNLASGVYILTDGTRKIKFIKN